MQEIDGLGLFSQEVSSSEMERALYSMTQNCVPSMTPYDFDPAFAERLYKVWRINPFVMTCGFRSVEYDRARGRSGTSAHCKGLAADILCRNNEDRFHLVNLFIQHGFKRIGIAKNFIHVDMDSSKISPRIWTYDDKNRERR